MQAHPPTAHTPSAPKAPRRRFAALNRVFACLAILAGFGMTAFALTSVAASLGYAGKPGTLTVKECREVGRDDGRKKCFGPVHAMDGTLLDDVSSVDDEYRAGDRVAVRRIATLPVPEGHQHIGLLGLVAGIGAVLAGCSVPYFTTGTFPWRGTPPPGADLCNPGPRARFTRNALCLIGVCIAGVCTIVSLV